MNWKALMVYTLGILSIPLVAQSSTSSLPSRVPPPIHLEYQKRQPIPSTLVSRFPRKWYQEQQLLWAQYQKDHPTDPAGYFQNLRALQYLGLENSPVVPTTIERMKELLPEAPATQLISHWTEGKPMPDMASFWQTNREELLELGLMGPMITLAGYTGDKALQGEQLKAWDLTSSTSSNLLFLHHNLLHSVSKHGFLIVHDEELYWSLLSIQQQFEYRADVEVIFSNMLSDASYRELLQQQYGLITDFSDEGTDIVNHYLSDTDLNALKFIVANPDKNIHLPLWSKTLASNLRNQPIYVVGLTMQLSETDLDNLAIIRERLENEFYLDYLKVDFSPPTTYDAATPFERHYLVPMFLLVRQLDEAGESQEADAWWFLMKKIWKRLGNEDPLEQEINRASFADVFATLKYESVEGRYLDNIKAFDKNIKPIGNGLYAYVYETSNVDYGLWLQHLEDQGEASALAAAKPKLSGEQAEEWSTVSPYYFQNHPAFDNYPVVGISHRAAVAYCEWLTAIYNQTPRREFERVRFRLPTEEEWFEAAAWIEKFRSKDNPNEIVLEGPRVSLPKGETRIVDIDNYDFRFPWWDYFYPEPAMAMASTGCWGGNFNVMDIGCGDHKGDGGKYTVEVTKQWPNEYGLIHISGNVAEMIDQPGVAKGGSWGHTPEESYLMLQQRYSGTDYRVGFRVFMEVIEK